MLRYHCKVRHLRWDIALKKFVKKRHLLDFGFIKM